MSPAGGTQRPRLIVTDLDGTFLAPDRRVSDTNLAAARRAAELGIPFLVATGRPVRWLDVLDDLAEAHSQVIVSNGGAVFDLARRSVVQAFPVDPRVALAVTADLRAAVPGITFGFETPVGFGCEPDCPTRQRGEPGVVQGSVEDLLRGLGPVIKVLGFHPELGSDDLCDLAESVIASRLTLTYAMVSASYGMLELTAPGVTKASTLALLCAELGVDAADVVAFGDMPNDLAMLSWAGRGFVVANGHHSLLRGGFVVVPGNDEDGVGRTVLDLLG
ncbi:Putative phosphatase [Propionicimonas sp. T2.31MG-18]|uniref:HAD family hydrolase n=1 Tax=Propionicimonas sp. T2.31MG-18 TaxID=3157620 RepID=UPI0035EC0DE5